MVELSVETMVALLGIATADSWVGEMVSYLVDSSAGTWGCAWAGQKALQKVVARVESRAGSKATPTVEPLDCETVAQKVVARVDVSAEKMDLP